MYVLWYSAPLRVFLPRLALLKSSYCTLARPPAEFGKNVQRLEAEYLRGPRPQNGLEGLKLHLAARQEAPQRRAVPSRVEGLKWPSVALMLRCINAPSAVSAIG